MVYEPIFMKGGGCMKLGRRYQYRTDYLIRQADREYRIEQLGYMGKQILKMLRRAAWETLRLMALLAGTSLFAFIIVPAMELWPERTLVIAEMLAVLAFGVWLGGRIYAPGKRK